LIIKLITLAVHAESRQTEEQFRTVAFEKMMAFFFVSDIYIYIWGVAGKVVKEVPVLCEQKFTKHNKINNEGMHIALWIAKTRKTQIKVAL